MTAYLSQGVLHFVRPLLIEYLNCNEATVWFCRFSKYCPDILTSKCVYENLKDLMFCTFSNQSHSTFGRSSLCSCAPIRLLSTQFFTKAGCLITLPSRYRIWAPYLSFCKAKICGTLSSGQLWSSSQLLSRFDANSQGQSRLRWLVLFSLYKNYGLLWLEFS